MIPEVHCPLTPLIDFQRKDMFARPQVPLIDQLHQYGRELAVLKRMYQSYALIIESILSKKALAKGVSNDREPPAQHGVPTGRQTVGVPFSVAATVRFERLLDRIKNLALSEIEECLSEKESLVFLVRTSNIQKTHIPSAPN